MSTSTNRAVLPSPETVKHTGQRLAVSVSSIDICIHFSVVNSTTDTVELDTFTSIRFETEILTRSLFEASTDRSAARECRRPVGTDCSRPAGSRTPGRRRGYIRTRVSTDATQPDTVSAHVDDDDGPHTVNNDLQQLDHTQNVGYEQSI